MIPLNWKLLAVTLVVGLTLFFGVNYCRTRTERKDAAAEQKTKDAIDEAQAQKDSAALQTPGVVKADSNLTHQTIKYVDRPVPVVRWLHDTVSVDSSAWVPKPAYDTLAANYDSLARAAIAYRDSSRALLIRYPRIIIAQDTAIKYLQYRVDHPRPRRRCGLGATAGYGMVYHASQFPSGPGATVGITCNF